MTIRVLEFATILTILLGSYYVATVVFQWALCSTLHCSAAFQHIGHRTTLPIVGALVVIFAVISWFEAPLHGPRVIHISANAVLMLFSWIIFFRAVFIFGRLPRWIWLVIVLGVALLTVAYGALMQRSPLTQSQRSVQLSGELLSAYDRKDAAVAAKLSVLLDDRIEATIAGGARPPSWGEGPEKTWLSMMDWIEPERERRESTFGLAVTLAGNFQTWAFLETFLTWLIPMAFVFGRIAGLVRLQSCPEVEIAGEADRKILLIHTPKVLVVSNSREFQTARSYMPVSQLSSYTVTASHVSFVDALRRALLYFLRGGTLLAPMHSIPKHTEVEPL